MLIFFKLLIYLYYMNIFKLINHDSYCDSRILKILCIVSKKPVVIEEK